MPKHCSSLLTKAGSANICEKSCRDNERTRWVLNSVWRVLEALHDEVMRSAEKTPPREGVYVCVCVCACVKGGLAGREAEEAFQAKGEAHL